MKSTALLYGIGMMLQYESSRENTKLNTTMGKLTIREDKLVLDTTLSMTHPENKKRIKRYLNPDSSSNTGAFHGDRIKAIFYRTPVCNKKQIVNYYDKSINLAKPGKKEKYARINKSKVLRHFV